MNDSGTYSLMVRDGAGALDNVRDDKTACRYLECIRRILEHGPDVMELGGSVLNENGKVEMDAAIMDGRDLSAGAIAAVASRCTISVRGAPNSVREAWPTSHSIP